MRGKSHICTHQGFWRKTLASFLLRYCWGHSGQRGKLWTAVTQRPPPPSALSHQPGEGAKVSKCSNYHILKCAKAIMTGHLLQEHSNTDGTSIRTLLFCRTLKSSSWLCCVMRTLSADVIQPLQAKQSFSVIFAFSSFCFAPSYKHMAN